MLTHDGLYDAATVCSELYTLDLQSYARVYPISNRSFVSFFFAYQIDGGFLSSLTAFGHVSRAFRGFRLRLGTNWLDLHFNWNGKLFRLVTQSVCLCKYTMQFSWLNLLFVHRPVQLTIFFLTCRLSCLFIYIYSNIGIHTPAYTTFIFKDIELECIDSQVNQRPIVFVGQQYTLLFDIIQISGFPCIHPLGFTLSISSLSFFPPMKGWRKKKMEERSLFHFFWPPLCVYVYVCVELNVVVFSFL